MFSPNGLIVVMFPRKAKFVISVIGRIERLTSAPVLRHYDHALPIRIGTDASDGIIGGVLSQEHEDGWHPVAFYCKTMSPTKCNYEVHDKDMLAIVKAFKEWRVETGSSDSQVIVSTDHKALEYFMTTKQLTGRQARWRKPWPNTTS